MTALSWLVAVEKVFLAFPTCASQYSAPDCSNWRESRRLCSRKDLKSPRLHTSLSMCTRCCEVWVQLLVMKRKVPNKSCCHTKGFVSAKPAFMRMRLMRENHGPPSNVTPRRCQKLTARRKLQTAAISADTMGDNQCPCKRVHKALDPIRCAFKTDLSLVIHFRSKLLVWPWNQRPHETRGLHLVRYKSSLNACPTRRSVSRGRIFHAVSTRFCAVGGKVSRWEQKSTPRTRVDSTKIWGSMPEAIMAARFCTDLQTICILCKFSRRPNLWLQCCHVCSASTASWGLEHAMALSSI